MLHDSGSFSTVLYAAMSLIDSSLGFDFDNSFVRLGEAFGRPVIPSAVSGPSLIVFNEALAYQLGGKPYDADFLSYFSGNALPEGAKPISQAYAGHQFGSFNPQLGDGRAVLLGEVLSPDGKRFDLQLKGAGITPFSRGGDGRAALGPVLREYLMSEAMHALGVPTTRALAAVTTGEQVWRERAFPGAILTRIASSHIRIGTFEYFARKGARSEVKILADHVISRHYPECLSASNPYLALFDRVADAQAQLVAKWMSLGFVHGVMNTDNTSICGQTIDYGPCAFVDAFSESASFSSIDTGGRYAYGRQGSIVQWNLARFAECLLYLFDDDIDRAVSLAEQKLADFPALFDRYWYALMSDKLGLSKGAPDATADHSAHLVKDLLALMERGGADFTLSFRSLSLGLKSGDFTPFEALFSDLEVVDVRHWLVRWQEALLLAGLVDREVAENMLKVNPSIIPRNHQVEKALSEALEAYDPRANEQVFPYFSEMIKALNTPYCMAHDGGLLAASPLNGGRGYRTFCGT